LKLPWPELASSRRAGESIRRILDYIAWASRELQKQGFHAGAGVETWRQRVQQAYEALFVPVLVGYGDPYPPDVPPARHPGTWPDLAAAVVTGMTIRHQLKVINLLANQLRDRIWPHAREGEVDEWDRRLCRAREVLEQGDGTPIPEGALTAPSEAVLAEAAARQRAMVAHARKRERRLQRLVAKAQQDRRSSERAEAAERREAAGGKARASGKPASKGAKAKKAAPRKAKPAKKPAGKRAAGKRAASTAKKVPRRKGAATKAKGRGASRAGRRAGRR
jgi:hypothetical protein